MRTDTLRRRKCLDGLCETARVRRLVVIRHGKAQRDSPRGDPRRAPQTFELGLVGTPVCERAVVDPLLYNGARDVTTAAVLESLAAADPGTGDLIHVRHNPTGVYLATSPL